MARRLAWPTSSGLQGLSVQTCPPQVWLVNTSDPPAPPGGEFGKPGVVSRHTLRCYLLKFAFMAMFYFCSKFWRFLAKIIEFKQRGLVTLPIHCAVNKISRTRKVTFAISYRKYFFQVSRCLFTDTNQCSIVKQSGGDVIFRIFLKRRRKLVSKSNVNRRNRDHFWNFYHETPKFSKTR